MPWSRQARIWRVQKKSEKRTDSDNCVIGVQEAKFGYEMLGIGVKTALQTGAMISAKKDRRKV